MPLLYVDESFNADEFWVSGLLVPERRACELEESLDSIVEGAAVSYKIPSRAELHGHDLAQGKKDWAVLAGNLRARLGIYRAALKAIHDVPDIRGFHYGLNRKKHQAKYSTPWPERQVLIGHVAQRAHNLIGREERLVIVVDDSPAQESMRDHVRELKRFGTYSRFNPQPLRKIVDTLYFAPSHTSRLLQASDLVSYMHFRARHPGTDPRAVRAAQEMWALVSSNCQSNLWAM